MSEQEQPLKAFGSVIVRVEMPAELLHAARWALKANVDTLARHAKRFPNSEFDWPKAVAQAQAESKAFDEALSKSEIVSF